MQVCVGWLPHCQLHQSTQNLIRSSGDINLCGGYQLPGVKHTSSALHTGQYYFPHCNHCASFVPIIARESLTKRPPQYPRTTTASNHHFGTLNPGLSSWQTISPPISATTKHQITDSWPNRSGPRGSGADVKMSWMHNSSLKVAAKTEGNS